MPTTIHRNPIYSNVCTLVFFAIAVVICAMRPSLADDVDAKEETEIDQAVVSALDPLFQQIRSAQSTRATVKLSADTVIDGAVITSQASVYQVASTAPGQFTVYLKDDTRRVRFFCDGKQTTIALSPTAFTVLEKPIPMQQAVFALPVPMGPYPEVVMALTLASVDPSLTLTTGIKSLKRVGPTLLRGKEPAIQFSGVQDDEVQWDLWISRDAKPKPLRLIINLTDMLRANGDLEMPAGYQFILTMDFTSWRIDHKNNPSLYRYPKIDDAKEYPSIESYYAEQTAENPDSGSKATGSGR